MILKKFSFSLLVCLLSVFVASAQLDPNRNFTARGTLSFGSMATSDVWGYTDTQNKEYALVGVDSGMYIVDVTNPDQLVKKRLIPTAVSDWHDISTWQNYAYCGNETSGGLLIVNLANLPNANAITYTYMTTGGLNTIHSLHAENGFLYLNGTNLSGGGVIIYSLANPAAPVEVGRYINPNNAYVHDSEVRGDLLIASHINGGFFTLVNLSNKAMPVLVATQQTPLNFTHNADFSDDGNFVFITDEKNNMFVTSYDISNPANIKELDRVQSNPNSQSIGHNTSTVANGYMAVSYYKDGMTSWDISRPSNIVQIGNYDTNLQTGGGFDGVWAVHPYLPSGNWLATDISNGLFVATPTLKRACFLEGIVTDQTTSALLSGVKIEFIGTNVSHLKKDLSLVNGKYALGVADSGTYQIRVSKVGYITQNISINLQNNAVTIRNIPLQSLTTIAIGGTISQTNAGVLGGATVQLTNTDFNFTLTTNANGTFNATNVYPGTYEVFVGKWGYMTKCFSNVVVGSGYSLTAMLDKSIYDDFAMNFAWVEQGNASTGRWVRAAPVGTFNGSIPCNPAADVATDCGLQAYITGNGGGGAGDDDVDNGTTKITSPVFALNTYTNPMLSYARWFYNAGGTGLPNDSLNVYLSNGTVTKRIESVVAASANSSIWVTKMVRVLDFMPLSATMTCWVVTGDYAPGHLVESGFDKFSVVESVGIDPQNAAKNTLNIYPNPAKSMIGVEAKGLITLEITDVLGKVVQRFSNFSVGEGIHQINVSLLDEGIYFIKTTNSQNEILTGKFIKE